MTILSMTDEDKRTSDNRRQQLRRWIAQYCNGRQSIFIASTNDGTKQINQGELSALLRNKSFGERKARSLEKQAGMPTGYLDWIDDRPSAHAMNEPGSGTIPAPTVVLPRYWPFTIVSADRLKALKQGLGLKRGTEAIVDIDRTLEVAVLKWEKILDEQQGKHQKSNSG